MRPAASALAAAVAFAAAPAAVNGQGALTERVAAAVSAAPRDSLLPIVIEWETPEPAPGLLAPGPRSGPAAVSASLEPAVLDRRAAARAFLESRGLGPAYREGAALWVASASAAEATPAAIEALARAPGVRRVYLDDWIAVDGLAPTPSSSLPPAFVPFGVELVRAPELWQAGITGKGTLVAFIDSGVDGAQPMLAARWRGRSRSAREAWLDPFNRSAVPADDIGHGTVVATTAVGALAAGDTLIAVVGGVLDTLIAQSDVDLVAGVAPEAEWIAANAFERFGLEDYTRRSILLQAMQWVLDPDGDPATTDDVPDVLNNSWGELPATEADFCTGVYHRAIDALERAGIAVVFASGNRGPDEPVPPPASRADLLTNAFAVGAVEPSGDSVVVSSFSQGGPSPCDPSSVKPEVVAPGRVPTFVRVGDGAVRQLGQATGTSFAAPHAAGAVALLRQANPAISSTDAKRALLETAQDLYPPGPDNRSGTGLIDVVAAAGRAGVSVPGLLRLVRWTSAGTQPDTLFFILENTGGDPLSAGTLALEARPSGALLGSEVLPALAPGDTAAVGPYAVAIPVTEGLPVTLVASSGGRTIRIPLFLWPKVGSAGGVVLQDGVAEFGLDGAGRYGRVAAPSGFVHAGRDLLRAAALLVYAGGRLSDAAYVDVLGDTANKTLPASTGTDWQLRSRVLLDARRVEHVFDDADALRPTGAVVPEAAALTALGDSAAYVTIDVGLSVPGAVVGLFADFDLGRDSVHWSPALGALVFRSPTDATAFAAVAAIGPVSRAVAVPLGRRSTTTTRYVVGTGELTTVFEDEEKVAYLTGFGRSTSDTLRDDWAALLTVGPLEPDTVRFLLAVASSETALGAALAAARAGSDPAEPRGRALRALAPFPNPFNPLVASSVRFPFEAGPELRSPGSEAVLEVFTLAGRPVYRQQMPLDPGTALPPFEWDGRTADGSAAASGMYVYRIRAGGRIARGKFLIFK